MQLDQDIQETDTCLRDGYARYFFSMMEARLQDDEQAQLEARFELEKLIGRASPAPRQTAGKL